MLKVYRNMCRGNDCAVAYLQLYFDDVTLEECIERNNARTSSGSEKVATKTIQNIYDKILVDLEKTLRWPTVRVSELKKDLSLNFSSNFEGKGTDICGYLMSKAQILPEIHQNSIKLD